MTFLPWNTSHVIAELQQIFFLRKNYRFPSISTIHSAFEGDFEIYAIQPQKQNTQTSNLQG